MILAILRGRHSCRQTPPAPQNPKTPIKINYNLKMEKNSDIQDVKYRVSVVKHDIVNNEYANYLIKIWVETTNIVFHIRDRYSGIRQWQDAVRNDLENIDAIPNYPAKKWFGNLDPQFLR